MAGVAELLGSLQVPESRIRGAFCSGLRSRSGVWGLGIYGGCRIRTFAGFVSKFFYICFFFGGVLTRDVGGSLECTTFRAR